MKIAPRIEMKSLSLRASAYTLGAEADRGGPRKPAYMPSHADATCNG
jgi:hypothetical protein